MTLNTPFSDVMPALSAEKYAALKADIEQAGLTKSILVDEDNNIIDGHHRYKACSELGIAVKIEPVAGIGSEQDKRLRIIALNLTQRDISAADRRRLSDEQKNHAMHLLGSGRRVAEVARLVGRPIQTVYDWSVAATQLRSGVHAQPCVSTKKDNQKMTVTVADDVNVALSVDEQKQKALELAASGMRVSDISTAVGRSTSTINDWIADPKSKPTTQGIGGGPSRKLNDSDVERLFNDGKTAADIAEELGAGATTVGSYLKRLGLSRAGKKAKNLLVDHISRAESQAEAWSLGADSIAAAASVSSGAQVKELISALSRLSKAASTLKTRLNKEAGKEE